VTADVEQAVVDAAVTEAPFKISRRMWKQLLAELVRRGDGRRESGAFLLADRDGTSVTVVAYYDDLDANCLTGGISFASSGFTELWRICGAKGLKVVADLHTHPGQRVMQSDIDATNPMIARVGHVAMIVPCYGHARSVRDCGVHIYLGSRQWFQVPADSAESVMRIYGLLSRDQIVEWGTALARLVRRFRGGRR
jgi:proteasome lid subunit RPN8/RPN11